MDTKAGDGQSGEHLDASQLRRDISRVSRDIVDDGTGWGTRCPSVLDIARIESGDLGGARRAVVIAHAGRCSRCGLTIAELREARNEILGPTPHARFAQSQRAAAAIENILRLRLH